ncbi:MAG: DUF370 domain-containing protein [Candidatus Manganitrophus sp.]|nr:DUF370 domain-containing protein [Candidatus Manganitrophus sp.]WDT72287.1 MAG: DUF370 domain-containing protein [Candidatus Manganitrophus sp.]WDT80276.1 MAG: DUF370 domain-containing protein [Candidatus Manganitrophus sp.]
MPFKLVNIGFGNVVPASRIVAVVAANSSPMRRFKEEARAGGKLVDASQGRKTRTVIITDSGHVILSAIQPETIAQRFASDEDGLPAGSASLDEKKGRKRRSS